MVLPDTSIVLPYRVQTGYYTPNGALIDRKSWSKPAYRVVANYKVGESSMLWASYATGYKSGGFNSFSIANFDGDLWGRYAALPGVDVPASFEEETVDSYEVGYKATFNGSTQLAVNGFIYDYKDLQSIFTVGPVQVVGNVGKVKGYGAEGSLNHAFNENWTVGLSVSWFDSDGSGVQPLCGDTQVCEGNSIPWAPEWTGFLLVNSNHPIGNGGAIVGNFRWSVESDRRTSWESLADGSISIDGYDEAQFTIGYQSAGAWRLTAFVQNVFDSQYFDGAADGGDPGNPFVNHDFGPNLPRTFGMRLLWNFD